MNKRKKNDKKCETTLILLVISHQITKHRTTDIMQFSQGNGEPGVFITAHLTIKQSHFYRSIQQHHQYAIDSDNKS